MTNETSPRTTSEVFGSRLRQARERQGWNQEDVANKLENLGLKLDRTAIAKIEGGYRKLSLDEAVAIAAVLNVALVHMCVPLTDTQKVRVADQTVDASRMRAWVRGERPLRDTDDLRVFLTEAPEQEFRDRLAHTERSASAPDARLEEGEASGLD